MRATSFPLLFGIGLALAAAWAPARAGEPAGESDWVEYRDAYREMIWFEKYGQPKQFLQNHYRVRPRAREGVALDGLRLTLAGKSTHLTLVPDVLGRVVFPFSKAAFDENAELTLNRKPGQFLLGPWVSIVTRPDGVYAAADLRAACDQVLAYLRSWGVGWNGKGCVGVQFAYGKGDTDAQVQFRGSDRGLLPLAPKEGAAFPGDVQTGFKVYVYRFAAMPEAGFIVTRSAPLAISALIE